MNQLKEMNIREILEQSYLLYKSSFLGFIGIVLLIKGPYLILIYIISQLVSPFSLRILELLSVPFLDPFMIAAMTLFLFEKLLNSDISVTEAYKMIMKRFIPLGGTILISGLLISSGFIAGLILIGLNPQIASFAFMFAPFLAFMLWVWFMFIPQIVIIEGEGGIGAMKRSRHLAEGYFRKIFILVIAVFLILSLIAWAISFGIGKLALIFGLNGFALGEGLSNVISILCDPFRIAIVPLLYYDLRARKEGFDTEIMEEELGKD